MNTPGPLCPDCRAVVQIWPDYGSAGADCPKCGWEMDGAEPPMPTPPPMTKALIEKLRAERNPR